MIKTIKNISLSIAVACVAVFSACEDNIRYGEEVGEGAAKIEGTIQFKSFAPALSRSNGNSLDELKSLNVYVYNEAGTELIKQAQFTPNGGGLTVTNNNNTAPEGATNPQPGPTNRGTFNLGLDYGKYKIYAVANADMTDRDVSTETALKQTTFQWDSNNITNNGQMFGWFTERGTGANANNVTENSDYNAPVISINRSNMQLTAWLVRLASKVTVAFDGTGLNSGVYIYIHDVSIRQIPLSCALGVVNHPTDTTQITSANYDAPVETPTQVLCYNTGGYTGDWTTYDVENYRDWLRIDNNTEAGSTNHLSSDPSLFFYENVQGEYKDDPHKDWYDKNQKRDSVGTNIEPGMNDYRDNVKCGTFIEVQAYYRRTNRPVTYGAIRYRFMLGQDTEYNYNALRNYHYKVTLGFNGNANNPDWHVEYREPDHEIFADEVYVPYSYNTYVDYPITITGSDLQGLEAEIIENNWGPYLEGAQYEVPAESSYGSTNFNLRTLEFVWWRDLFINSSGVNTNVNMNTVSLNGANPAFVNTTSNYLYGRHPGYNQDDTPQRTYHLDYEGNNIASDPYLVTPIWAGFLRLQQPESYNDFNVKIPAYLYRNLDCTESDNYGGCVENTATNNLTKSRNVLNAFRNFYFGKATSLLNQGSDESDIVNTTNLSKRKFETLNVDQDEVTYGAGTRNQYTLIRNRDNKGNTISTTIVLRLWTQPKSMCGISGFSGNNPYEDYLRKAVIRFTARFRDNTVVRDVDVFQARRMINPKAVWRSHAKPQQNGTYSGTPDPFTVTLYQRDISNTANLSKFNALTSQGAWSASITQGNEDGFITLEALGSATGGGTSITGKDNTEINFKINFTKAIAANESKCAIVEVRYHNNSCVHNIYVRQGYREPVQLTSGGAYWSSFNVYYFEDARGANPTAVLTTNPLAFGGMFKRGHLNEAISVSNISDNTAAFGPLAAPGSTPFSFNGGDPPAQWSAIAGSTLLGQNANFKKRIIVKTNGQNKNYRIASLNDYRTLIDNDFGIGVLYGDGATAPATTTTDAFGYMDGDNTTISSKQGMRGFICYDSEPGSAEHIFFPIGTTGMGRRTIQFPENSNQRGVLRYGSVYWNLNTRAQDQNSCRPVAVNMKNAPGAIYWLLSDTFEGTTYYAWDMNFFDLNFNGTTSDVVIRTDQGGGGDALPIRLVTDNP
ncbi:MAG: hypothetical protein K2N79_04235 [Muribaculaceae bacterium]|nr:hypothetical protein [Muribaculaceae bacterium]MDE7368628.1 hypothetical protein [Muribaculaceae bacterium]